MRKRISNEGKAIIQQALGTLENALIDGRGEAYLATADHAVAILRQIPTIAAQNEVAAAVALRHPAALVTKERTKINRTFGSVWSRAGLDAKRKQQRDEEQKEVQAKQWRVEGKCGRCGATDHKNPNSKKCQHYKPRAPRVITVAPATDENTPSSST